MTHGKVNRANFTYRFPLTNCWWVWIYTIYFPTVIDQSISSNTFFSLSFFFFFFFFFFFSDHYYTNVVLHRSLEELLELRTGGINRFHQHYSHFIGQMVLGDDYTCHIIYVWICIIMQLDKAKIYWKYLFFFLLIEFYISDFYHFSWPCTFVG